MDRIKVIYDDSPVHCIDVGNTAGQWFFRIFPSVVRIFPSVEGGATIRFDSGRCMFGLALDPDDLHDLVSALERITR